MYVGVGALQDRNHKTKLVEPSSSKGKYPESAREGFSLHPSFESKWPFLMLFESTRGFKENCGGMRKETQPPVGPGGKMKTARVLAKGGYLQTIPEACPSR